MRRSGTGGSSSNAPPGPPERDPEGRLASRASVPLAARLILSVALLAILVFVVADPHEVARDLAHVHPGVFVVAIALTAADRVLMAFKWRLLLLARGVSLDLWTAVRAYFAASFAGLFLPVTLGADAIRVMVVRQLGVFDVTASIVVERLLGFVAVATVAVASSLFLIVWVSDLSHRIAFVVFGTAIVLALIFLLSLRLTSRWLVGRRLPYVLAKLAEAYGAYQRHPGTLAVFYLLSVVECFVPILVNYVAARGLDLDIPLPVLLVTIPVALTIARLPISFGGFGVQEASFVYLAGQLGVPAASALSTMLLADVVLLITLLPAAFDASMLNLARKTT